MTENVAKPGCISKSLDKFLKVGDDKKRKQKYGNVKSAKYYERIVTEVNASFVDHQNVVTKLPDEHLKKIDFMNKYNIMMNLLISKKLYAKTPSLLVKETTEQLRTLKKQIGQDAYLKPLAEPDFERVIKWLEYVQENSIVKRKPAKKKPAKKKPAKKKPAKKKPVKK